MSLYSRPRWAISPWLGPTSLVPLGFTVWLVTQGENAAAVLPGLVALALILYTITANVLWAQERKRLAYVPTPHRDTYTPVSRRSWKLRGKAKA